MVCQNGVVAGFDIRKLQATTFVSDPQDFVLEAWRPPKVSLEPYLGWFDWGFHSLQTTSSDTFNNHMSLSHRKSKQIRRNRRFGEGDEDETSDLEDELVDYEGENLLVEMLGDGGTGNPVNASHLSSTHFSPTQNGIFSTANHNGTISVYEINRGGDFSSSSMTNSNEEEEEEEVVEERDEGTVSIVHKVSRKFHSNPLFQIQFSPDDPNTLLSGGMDGQPIIYDFTNDLCEFETEEQEIEIWKDVKQFEDQIRSLSNSSILQKDEEQQQSSQTNTKKKKKKKKKRKQQN